jgi:Xaa-Pro dipeptidase
MLDGGDAEFGRAWAIERDGPQVGFEATKLGAACTTSNGAIRVHSGSDRCQHRR